MSVLPRRKPPVHCPLCKEMLRYRDGILGNEVTTDPRDHGTVTAVVINVEPHRCPSLGPRGGYVPDPTHGDWRWDPDADPPRVVDASHPLMGH